MKWSGGLVCQSVKRDACGCAARGILLQYFPTGWSILTLPWGPFLESPETFREHFGWHNPFCILKAKVSLGRKLCSCFNFYSLYNIWKAQLYRISLSEFYKWLFGPEKFSELSRNSKPLALNTVTNWRGLFHTTSLEEQRKASHVKNRDCYLHVNGCIIMQLIVSSHANCVIESRLVKKDCLKMPMIVVSCRRSLVGRKWQYTYSQWMLKEGIVYLLMILNVNTYANVILERSLH